MRAGLVIALLLAGCTAREGAAWVPRLTVRGALVHRVRVDEGAERWSWQIQGAARWSERTSAPARVEPPSVRRPMLARDPAPCGSEILCAWERRARERAHREVLESLVSRPGSTRDFEPALGPRATPAVRRGVGP